MSRRDPRFEQCLGDGAAAVVALFDALPIGISVMWPVRDPGGTVQDFALGYANATAGRLLGVPLDGELGTRMSEAMPGLFEDGQFARFAQVADSGAPSTEEIVMDAAWRDAVRVRGVWASTAVPFADGVLCVNLDITEERRRQQELRDFAAVAAHDLREPLIGIGLVAAGLAAADDLPPHRRAMAALVGDGVQHAKRLVDGILEYAGAEREAEGRESVDLDAVLADVRRSLAEQVRAAGGAIDVGPLPTLWASRNGMTRVFQNLVANAVKFRDPGRPLRIAVAAAPDDGGWGFSVTDNGIGLPPDSEIFEMFERGVSHVEGSGIGLATCRRIVEAHGGSIWAEPAPGAGTVLRFTITAAATG